MAGFTWGIAIEWHHLACMNAAPMKQVASAMVAAASFLQKFKIVSTACTALYLPLLYKHVVSGLARRKTENAATQLAPIHGKGDRVSHKVESKLLDLVIK